MPQLQHGLSLKQRNHCLINQIKELTGAKKKGGWSSFQEKINASHVKEFYRIYCELFPLELVYDELIPKPGNTTRALFTGELRAETIILNVNRYALYCDDIVVIHPINHPYQIAPHHNPLLFPSEFLQDTLHIFYFLLKLEPWVKNGVVSIVPNPFDFKPGLRQDAFRAAETRLKTIELSKSDLENETTYLKLDLLRTLYGHSRDSIIELLKELQPAWDENLEDLADKAIQIHHADPLVIKKVSRKSNILFTKNAVNLEGSLFLAAMTGSFLYTDSAIKWREIDTTLPGYQSEKADWTAFTKAFQQLEFSFLNAVDPEFACGLRTDNRLENFRLYMKKTWRKLSKRPTEETSKALMEELNDEFLKARFEWEKISLEVQKWFLPELASAAIAMGQMNINPGLGIIPTAVGHLLHKHLRNRSFRKNTPLSVFIDLESREGKNRSKPGKTIKS